nr:CDP-glycerol glycerophosphotransferase family protein [Mesobacillus maritimus]
MKNYVTKANHKRVNQYAVYYEKLKVKENTILYESRDGNSMTDSPYAMFSYMLQSTEFKDFLHIWSIADFNAMQSVIAEYEHLSNVKFVQRNSKEYLKYLSTCQYLINNSTFQSFFIPKKEQVYLNTWHGTPLKKMGFDIPGNPSHSQNVLRNFLSTTYLLSPNSHTTKMFTDSYKLQGLYEGTIIEEGYPRIDLTLNTNAKRMRDRLRRLDLVLEEGKETILYAPTWKGTNVAKANNDVLQIIADMSYIEQQIGNKYNLLIKVHPYLFKEAVNYQEIKSKLVPDYVDTNELLATVDILITDYSSIFFDFLVTNKPIIFFTWDADIYSEERGQYLSNDTLPGPFVYNARQLAETIQEISTVKERYREKYEKMKREFTIHDDGNVTERVVQFVFKKTDLKINTITAIDIQKERLLIYPGGMFNNGITSSFINLMNNIDYEKYDVSCFTATPRSNEVLNNLSKVNKNVRFLFKPGLPVYKLAEVYQDKWIHNRGKTGFLGNKFYPSDAYKREHARLFGKVHFDYVIDFSGYSHYWAKYLLAANAKKKVCYMHNDLLSESEKVINGRRPHRLNLRGLFSVYYQFDRLVSVSKGTMELNRNNLLEYAEFEKFDYVMNSIDPAKILGSNDSDAITLESEEKGLSETHYIKARATIKNVEEHPVWTFAPGHENATLFSLGKEFNDAEITLIRKALDDEENEYYKFSLQNQIIGWIHSNAVEILPDKINNIKEVNKFAILTKPDRNHIWSKPYNTEGIHKVSNSHEYKGLLFEVNQEAETLHGTYSQISINGTFIGWIDNAALNVIENCTITDQLNPIKEILVKRNRTTHKERNEREYKRLIESIEHRILYEETIQDGLYVQISKPEEHPIWNRIYPPYKMKKLGDALQYAGETVKATKLVKTKDESFYRFEVDGKSTGWISSDAVEELVEQPIISEKEVFKVATLPVDKHRIIWTKPYGVAGARLVPLDIRMMSASYYYVDREVVTLKGSYSRLVLNGDAIGWVDSQLLTFNEPFGIVVGNKVIPEPEDDYMNFIHMGRLSPEKGQDNLIHSFANFHKQNPDSKLYMLGDGILKVKLQQLIDDLEMNDAIYLLGQVENPFSLMKKCDCFVLSSHYEGQPMVLLEAMTLGMNIIATDIVANRTVLEDGKYGLLVDNSIDGLEQGMKYMYKRENQSKLPFDYLQYNELAMESFYKVLA